MICSGNICRSPTAEVVLRADLAEAGLEDAVEVISGGLGDWHVGDPMDRRAARLLSEHDYDPSGHRAQQVQPDWFDDCDVLFAMDAGHERDLRDLARRHGRDPERVVRFRDADPIGRGGEVPDPYYGGTDGFQEVLSMVERTDAAWLEAIAEVISGAGSDAGSGAGSGSGSLDGDRNVSAAQPSTGRAGREGERG